VVEAASQEETGRPLGDQGFMPGPPAAGGLAARGVETQFGGADVSDRPGPFGFEQPQQVQEVVRGIRGAGGQPARHLIQLGQRLATLVTMVGADLPSESQSAQQPGQGGRVEAGGERLQRHRRRGMPRQCDLITEVGGGDRAGTVHDDEGQRIDGWVGEDSVTLCGGVFATQYSGLRLATGN